MRSAKRILEDFMKTFFQKMPNGGAQRQKGGDGF
jgi:hypothetical protein